METITILWITFIKWIVWKVGKTKIYFNQNILRGIRDGSENIKIHRTVGERRWYIHILNAAEGHGIAHETKTKF